MRRVLMIAAIALFASAGAVVAAQAFNNSSDAEGTRAAASASTSTSSTSTSTTTTTIVPPRGPSDTTQMRQVVRVSGEISPKSVVASGRGIVTAQNMIYTHTVTMYDHDGNLLATIPDAVDLAAYGVPGYTGPVQGGPVEAAYTRDGKFVYVSNYSMYGPGFGHPGDDECSPSSGVDPSFVYRIDVATRAIDRVIAVGSVPKYLEVTPDGRYLLVTNWCSYDLSVIDAATGAEVKRIGLGRYPRGIAVDPTSRTAYVAVMGGRDIAKIDLATLGVSWFYGVGSGPRHLVMDPAGRFLYITLNGEGRVAKLDIASGAVVAKVSTGQAPRSATIAPDGLALYVVNYESNSVSKLRTADMAVLQEVPTDTHPIGITYEPTKHRVWVACYVGSILLFDDA